MVRPKKFLGQHFLKNREIALQIVEALSAGPDSAVLEIGPGTGVLTTLLQDKFAKLEVVELDRESVGYLIDQEILTPERIHESDFLKLDLNSEFETPLSIIGNFPYNISSQIVFKIIDNHQQVSEMVGMFQKEVADRIVAGPGSKTYGILSVLTAAYYDTEYLFTVEPKEFNPPPKVRSAVIKLSRRSDTPEFDKRTLFMVVKLAFNQRRKTLRNALKALNLSAEYTSSSIFDQRAEQLTLEDFIQIANRAKLHGT